MQVCQNIPINKTTDLKSHTLLQVHINIVFIV